MDYGPFGFVEQYDPDYIPNGSGGSGRSRGWAGLGWAGLGWAGRGRAGWDMAGRGGAGRGGAGRGWDPELVTGTDSGGASPPTNRRS